MTLLAVVLILILGVLGFLAIGEYRRARDRVRGLEFRLACLEAERLRADEAFVRHLANQVSDFSGVDRRVTALERCLSVGAECATLAVQCGRDTRV